MSLLAIAGGVLIGLTLGLTGAGGSIITLPVLVYLAKVGPREAVPLSLIVVGTAAFTGALRKLKSGDLCWATAWLFGISGMLGAAFGAQLTSLVDPRFLMILFAGLMLTVASLMFRLQRVEDVEHARAWWEKVGAGLGVGVLTGFIGVGGGFLLVPALLKFGGLGIRRAIGSSLAIIFFNCVAGFLSHLGKAQVKWELAIIYSILAVFGVLIGSHLAGRVPAAHLRKGFAVMVLITGGWVLYRNLVGG